MRKIKYFFPTRKQLDDPIGESHITFLYGLQGKVIKPTAGGKETGLESESRMDLL